MAAEANKPRKPLTIRLSYKYPCDARVSAQQELKLKFTSDVKAHGCYCVELCVSVCRGKRGPTRAKKTVGGLRREINGSGSITPLSAVGTEESKGPFIPSTRSTLISNNKMCVWATRVCEHSRH